MFFLYQNPKNNQDQSPLQLAVINCHLDIVKFLVQEAEIQDLEDIDECQKHADDSDIAVVLQSHKRIKK